jgi:hypothetical protein
MVTQGIKAEINQVISLSDIFISPLEDMYAPRSFCTMFDADPSQLLCH